jgi:hypothetical protein
MQETPVFQGGDETRGIQAATRSSASLAGAGANLLARLGLSAFNRAGPRRERAPSHGEQRAANASASLCSPHPGSQA